MTCNFDPELTHFKGAPRKIFAEAKEFEKENVVHILAMTYVLSMVRKILNISQLAVAERLEISRSKLRNIEEGETNVPFLDLLSYAELLLISKKEFMKIFLNDKISSSKIERDVVVVSLIKQRSTDLHLKP